MAKPPLMIVVLAAGKGTRMKSARPKVMHEIAGRSMLGHVLALTREVHSERVAVVVGPGMEAVGAEAQMHRADCEIFVQHDQRGTADAVAAASPALATHRGDVLVLYADTPLTRPETIVRLLALLDQGLGVAVLGFEAADPTGYGRLLTTADGHLTAIREHKDASEAERQITLCNSGVLAFRVTSLTAVLDRIGNANAKGEFYLTDAVEIIRRDGLAAGVVVCPEDEVLGVNARDQLAAAEAIWQRRARLAAMAGGVTMLAPDTVHLSYDTNIGQDVIIEPNVFFGPGVTVDAGAEIKANSYLEGAHVGRGARVGPFARLRPGADLGEAVHIGNFVEVKNVTMGKGAKANHLAYLGDGTVGAGSNVGAGTIFCNYDGFFKHTTTIGEGAFIGSNTSLVAPVKIGDGAYIGSGSVITKDVAAGDLALARADQVKREGWATKFREMMKRRKGTAKG